MAAETGPAARMEQVEQAGVVMDCPVKGGSSI